MTARTALIAPVAMTARTALIAPVATTALTAETVQTAPIAPIARTAPARHRSAQGALPSVVQGSRAAVPNGSLRGPDAVLTALRLVPRRRPCEWWPMPPRSM